jgi:hypothetical protein
MNAAPAPYREATPKAVCSLMASLALAAGQHLAAENYLSRLLTLLAVPRAPAPEDRR